MSNRFQYGVGYKTREQAEDALESCYAAGEITEGERPVIESYRVKVSGGKMAIRYKITLAA